MDSITAYVMEQGITAEITEVLNETQEKSEGYGRSFTYWMYNYRVRLHRGDSVTPEFDWSQGEGITESPDERPDRIFNNLIDEAWSYINARDFEDWAGEFGYDTDSRKAENMYRACGEIADWLAKFLDDDIETIATEYERL